MPTGTKSPRTSSVAHPPRLNAEWHKSHRMPKNPTLKQRLAWHEAHEKNCACRPMPTKLRALLR
jgi:hypothetical protein